MSGRPHATRGRPPGLVAGRSAGSLLPFFALLGALTVPFYAANALIRTELLPRLPMSAVAVVCPAIAGLVLSRREGGPPAAWSLIISGLNFRCIVRRPSVGVALLLMPAAEWASYLVPSFMASSTQVTSLSLAQLAGLATTFLVGAVCEEVGWSAYAVGRRRPTSPTLRTGVEIGAAWAAWHLVPLLSVGRSAAWVAWWTVVTITRRVLFVRLYRAAGGSAGVVAVSHALCNLVWMLIPSFGSDYDPRADAIATVAVAGAVVAWLSARAIRA